MTPADMAEVLDVCSAYDARKIGVVDVAAWHKSIGHLDKADAIEAVARHYATSRERIMPADVANGVIEIRQERAKAQHHEIRELPSRFELDDIRDERLRRGLALVAATLSPPGEPTDRHDIALVRARRERTRPMPMFIKKTGKPIDLAKIPGPEWDKTEIRERVSVDYLHEIGRPCGRALCTRDKCKPAPKEA